MRRSRVKAPETATYLALEWSDLEGWPELVRGNAEQSRGLLENLGLASSYAPTAAPPARGEAAGKTSNSRSGKDARSIGCAETTAGARSNGRERPYNVTTLPGCTDEEASRLPFLSGGRRRREREQLGTEQPPQAVD